MTKVETGFAGQTRWTKLLYTVFRSAVCWFTRVYTRMTIDGREYLPPTGAYVLAPVHRSYVDTPITACISRRRIRYMGKDTMWKYRAFGSFISALGAFPVSRGTVDREAMQRCVAVLNAGEPLVIFPEGERKGRPSRSTAVRRCGIHRRQGGVSVLPVGIGGSDRVMPRGAKFIFPRKVRVIVGEPIRAEVGPNGRASRTAIQAVTAQLHTELQRLYDQTRSV